MFRSNRSSVQEILLPIRILVIGAGYAGLLFTMRLAGKVARQHVQKALVNESDTFTERPRLHQFATNQVVQWGSLPEVLRRIHVQFIQGRVTSIDPAHYEIVLMHQQQTQHRGYDYLVYALGSETDRKTVPGVTEYAYTLAPSGPLSAAALRDTLPGIEARGGQIVVAGGGATGIETAAEVASAYPHLKVCLVTREPLALFLNKSMASSIRRRLVRLGVEIIDQVGVTAVRAQSVVTDQGIALGRHNAIGFNNYPDDKPIPPYFTGRLGYLIREGFVRYLAAATQRPGIFVWLGKRRYEHAQRRQHAQAKKHVMQLHRIR
jgi:NADH dehydrogenase FAD-containing subunit